MEKTRKCYHYFIMLSILFGLLFGIVFLHLHSGFSSSEKGLFDFLANCRYTLLAGFILSTSITIALRCIIDDLEWTLASLRVDTDDLSEKLSVLKKSI